LGFKTVVYTRTVYFVVSHNVQALLLSNLKIGVLNCYAIYITALVKGKRNPFYIKINYDGTENSF